MTTTDRPDPTEVAASLRSILASVDAGGFKATPVQRARIEGAVAACEVLAGTSVDDIVDVLIGGTTSPS